MVGMDGMDGMDGMVGRGVMIIGLGFKKECLYGSI
jgi:hypothetical protein